MLYISGQLGLDRETGQLVPGGVEAQTKKALQNMETVLQAANGKLKVNIATKYCNKIMNSNYLYKKIQFNLLMNNSRFGH